MDKPRKCLWCESERIEEGKLMALGGQVVFRPRNLKFWTLSEGSAPVVVRVCMDCGYLDLFASPGRLDKVVEEF